MSRDTVTSQRLYSAIYSWISEFAEKAWQMYVSRIEQAGLNHDTTSVEVAYQHFKAQQSTWTPILVASCAEAIKIDSSTAEETARNFVSRALGDSVSAQHQSYLNLRDNAILATERARSDQPRLNKNNLALIFGRDDVATNCIRRVVKSLSVNLIDFQFAKIKGESADDFNHEIIDRLFESCDGAIVILSPDERAILRPQLHRHASDAKEKYQARPNVIFEHGIALGKFGRRVIVVQFGDVELHSDVAGLHPFRWSDAKSMRNQLSDRLSAMGYSVKATGRCPRIKYVPIGDRKGYKDDPNSVDYDNLDWFQMSSDALNGNPQIQGFMKEGWRITSCRPSDLTKVELEGFRPVVIRRPNGTLVKLHAGNREDDKGSIWIMRREA
ncbi:MAG: nucleotide-binding protein [Fimbriimonadaceae bacterium]|nr:nucleotide-binding protein [Fimbriimonadaceae bacterium]